MTDEEFAEAIEEKDKKIEELREELSDALLLLEEIKNLIK